MRVSINDLLLYLQCPRAYKLHKLDGVTPQRKSAAVCKSATVRKVIPRMYASVEGFKNLTLEKIEMLCEEVWREEIADLLVDKQELEEIVTQAKPATKNKPAVDSVTKSQKSLGQIKTWCKNYFLLEQETNVLYNNVYFNDTIGDIEFYGWIQEIRLDPQGGLQIIQFKTSSQPPHFMFQSRDFQMSLLAHAVWQGQLFPEYPSLEKSIRLNTIPKTYYYYFPALEEYKRNGKKASKGEMKGIPLMEASRDEKTLLEFEYEILYAASGIQIGFFPMHVNPISGCSICSFEHQCQKAKAEIHKHTVTQEIEKINI
jgi:hypothetical protein